MKVLRAWPALPVRFADGMTRQGIPDEGASRASVPCYTAYTIRYGLDPGRPPPVFDSCFLHSGWKTSLAIK